MTAAEYEMRFGQWCNATRGTNYKLDQFGDIAWDEPKKKEANKKYLDFWYAERGEFCLKDKHEKIIHALERLKNEGIDCRLQNYANAHINAMSKHGQVYAYYATTGTIAGYMGTSIYGLDELIRLCKE